ncbi:uncharacterized protein LOC143035314 [Oratosquilla oratoria]|uniref:uncharacterized protein LOC143035314 n=1 Tax=Oratosquilla oratoria TaxID=337810 RepID=UPI003F777193
MASGTSSDLWTLSPDQKDLGQSSLYGSEDVSDDQMVFQRVPKPLHIRPKTTKPPRPGTDLTRLYWGGLTLKDWVISNLDWVRSNLRCYEAVHHPSVEVDEIKIDLEPQTQEKGNNYNPEVLRINAEADVYSWNPESGNTFNVWEYHFIVKLLSSNVYFTMMKAKKKCVLREKLMFEEVLPMLNDYMTHIDHPRCFPIPKLYISHFDKRLWLPKYALGIDVHGYESSPVYRTLGFELTKMAIQNLARLHGASYTFNKKYYLALRYQVFTTSTFGTHWALMPGCFKNLIKFLRDVGGHEETVRLLVRGSAEALSSLKNKFQERDSAVPNCLCHGDYRCAHLMFKEGAALQEGGAPRDAVLVTDWQQAMMMNPVYDVLFFLYTSTSKNLRKHHMKELLLLYYGTFTSACYPEDLKGYTFADFCDEIEEKSLFGFAMGICIAHFTLSKASFELNWKNSVKDNLRKVLGTPLFSKNSKSMKRVVMDLVSEAEENGNIRKWFFLDEGIRAPFSGRDVEKKWVQFVFDSYTRHQAKSTEYCVEDFYIHKSHKRNKGYDCEFVDMTVTTRNYTYDPFKGIVTEVQEHHITNKNMPLNQTYNRYREIHNAAEKESTMISLVLPTLNKFLVEKGRDKYCFHIPHVYFHEVKHMDYILLTQDYKVSGFEPEDNLTALSLQQVRAALAFLAKFHAVSHVYHREHDLNEKYPIILSVDNPRKIDQVDDFIANIMSPSLNTVMLLLSRFLKSREIMLKNKKQALDKVKKMAKAMEDSTFTCLCHGDFRTPNLLFREDLESGDHGRGNDVMILDWQSITIKHPVYDVLLFLYTSTTPRFRRSHLDEVLQEYHDNLVTIIMDLKLPGNFKYLERHYPHFEFRKQFIDARLFGFTMGLCLTQICDEYRPEEEEKVAIINRDPKVSKRLLQKFIRYNELFEEAEKDGILDGFYVSVQLNDQYGDPSDIHFA